MVEILVVAYVVLSLLATLLIWTVLIASKRLDDESQSMKYESLVPKKLKACTKSKEIKVE